MSKANRVSKQAVERELRRVLFLCPTYAQLEKAAGITDRKAFWAGKTEAEAKAAIRELIAQRIARGESGLV